MLKFLIDECLSPVLAGRARRRGYEAFHVNWLHKSGYRDYALMPYVLGGDFLIEVDSNYVVSARDFPDPRINRE